MEKVVYRPPSVSLYMENVGLVEKGPHVNRDVRRRVTSYLLTPPRSAPPRHAWARANVPRSALRPAHQGRCCAGRTPGCGPRRPAPPAGRAGRAGPHPGLASLPSTARGRRGGDLSSLAHLRKRRERTGGGREQHGPPGDAEKRGEQRLAVRWVGTAAKGQKQDVRDRTPRRPPPKARTSRALCSRAFPTSSAVTRGFHRQRAGSARCNARVPPVGPRPLSPC